MQREKQTPLIRENELTGGWVVITKYRVKHNKKTGLTYIEAKEKFDVTDQISQIHEILKSRRKKKKA